MKNTQVVQVFFFISTVLFPEKRRVQTVGMLRLVGTCVVIWTGEKGTRTILSVLQTFSLNGPNHSELF